MAKKLNPNTNYNRLLELLKEKAVTGMDIVIQLGILSYNSCIFRLRKYGYNIITTIIYNPETGKRHGLFQLVK